MNRGHNREPVFADDEDRRAFVELVARYRDRVGFRLLHYCLMRNHFHLLVKLPDPRLVSTLVAGLLRDELASEPQDRQERWRSFLLGEGPREQAVRRGDWVIGDDAFRLRLSQARGRPVPRGRGRLRKSNKPGQVQFYP
jgi:REP element-mobilizing transposase RayT